MLVSFLVFSLVAMQSGYKPGLICIMLLLENPLHTGACRSPTPATWTEKGGKAVEPTKLEQVFGGVDDEARLGVEE